MAYLSDDVSLNTLSSTISTIEEEIILVNRLFQTEEKSYEDNKDGLRV